MALVPADVKKLSAAGWSVAVQRGAGAGAFIDDGEYAQAGAAVVGAPQAMASDVVVTVRGPEPLLATPARPVAGAGPGGTVFVGVFDPLWAPHRARQAAAAGLTTLSLDLVPRITRAQSMDVLSSMGTIAGYEAVLVAASRLPQMFPLMMTAAGTLKPARVLVLGAGVAGLQALATSRRLGAVVSGYDIRPAALEQIRSMGARAVELQLDADAGGGGDAGAAGAATEDAGGYARAQTQARNALQRERLAPHVASADVVLATAAIPGRASPLLVTAEMVEAMRPGSVLVDLAVERGGNCAVTRADTETVRGGVTVLGPTDLVSRSARHASQMFSHNLTAFLRHAAPDGEFKLDDGDEITAAMLVTRRGEIVNEAVASAEAEAAAAAGRTAKD